MGRRNEKYKDYCSKIYDTAKEMIEHALVVKLGKWAKDHPDITAFINERAKVIDNANAMVKNIDPKLSVSGPISQESNLTYTPQWVKDAPWNVLWFQNWGKIDYVFRVALEHKPILEIEGGAFRPVAEKYSLLHACDDNAVNLLQAGDLIVLPQAVHDAVLWADNQYRLLYGEYVEWTHQFRVTNEGTSITPQRGIDLSFYFSPVFGSFSAGGRAKVFSQRPRVENYQPMSTDLASLLTMARASRHYATRHWAVG